MSVASDLFEVVDRAPTSLTDRFRPLTLDSYRRLTRAFPPRRGSAQYGSGWLYLTQACRNALTPLGSFYEDATFAVGLGRHNNHWVIVRPVGQVPPTFLSSLLALVRSTGARPYVYVKMADSPMRRQIRQTARARGIEVLGAKHYPWDASSRHDDQTCPDVLMDVSQVCDIAYARGEPARKLRSKVRRFHSLYPKVTFTTVAALGHQQVRAMLSQHFGADQSYIESYTNMITILGAPSADDTWWHFVPVIDGEAVGLFAYELVDTTSAAVYASVAHHRYTGLNEAMMVEMSMRMRGHGFLTANLGGSEKLSLYRYKLKFAAKGGSSVPRHPICVLDFSSVL